MSRYILPLALLFILAIPAWSEWESDQASYDGAGYSFTIPGGWRANDVKDEVFEGLMAFDDKLVRTPLEVAPDNDEGGCGMIVITSGRDDSLGTMIDFILMRYSPEVKIYNLYEGESEFIDGAGKSHKTKVKIQAMEADPSEMLVYHDIITFNDDLRYEFAFFSRASMYGGSFDAVETVLGSIVFKEEG